MRVLIFSVSRTMSKPATRPGAGGGREQAAEHADGGGLARAVRSEEAEDLAAPHGERNAGDGLERAEALLEVVHLDDGLGRLWLARGCQS